MATRLVPDNDTAWGPDFRELVTRKNQLTDDVTGKVPPTQLGTGTRDGTRYLRDDGSWQVVSGGSGITTVQDEGAALTARTVLNFIGRSVTAADNAGSSRTDVTVLDTPTVHAVGNSGTALTLDASAAAGYIKTITLTANCTFTLTGASTGQAAALELVLTQDATGSRTVTWPASVKWSGGAPVLTTTAGAVDRIVLTSYNGGTTWYGDLVGKGYA